jgi:cell division protein FtsB
LKLVANSYSAKIAYGQVTATREVSRAWLQALRMPNWVWLAMIFLAASALALTTIARGRTQLRVATASSVQTEQRLAQTQTVNEKLKGKIRSVKNDSRAIQSLAQDRLNSVRANEIVVATR